MKKLPDIELLNKLFSYDKDTGIIRWKIQASIRIKVGDIVGCYNSEGYRVCRIQGTAYALHRVIWKLMTGEDPMELNIDHIDRDRANNKWSNLRLTDSRGNCENRGIRRTSKTGYTGVSRDRDRYRAQIVVRGEYFYLGTFPTPEEASVAYETKKQELLA